MVFIKKAKLSKKLRKNLTKKYKQSRRQTKKASIHRGGASSCESAYITESGFSIPDNGSIKGFTLASKRALLRGNMFCKSNHASA
jgi:hypothetical protein